MAPRPLRIAMLAFAPNYHTTRWTRALAAAGFDVHVVCAQADDYCVPGIPVHVVTFPRRWGLPVLSTAAMWHRAIARVQPDVVYMQWLFGRPAMLAALDPAWPLVITVMGSDVRQDADLKEIWLDRLWRTALLMRADALTAAARPLADAVHAYGPGLAGRVQVVPFGVDTRQFHPAEPRTGKDDGRVSVGHFKSDEPVYGRLQLLQAVEPLIRQGRSIDLHLAGRRGNDGGAVTRYLAEHPHVSARVRDHGVVGVDEMPALYRDIDIYVLNSYHESFGVAAAEALACAVPVIACDVGGVRALVRDGDTGILVPAGDVAALRAAVEELAHYPDLRRSCGQRGRARVRSRFEWQATVDQMAEIIRTAASQRQPTWPVTEHP